VTNISGANHGLPGDILAGTFRTLPGLSSHEARGIVYPGTRAFMLVNALAVPNTVFNDWNGTGGTAEETRQRVRVTVRLTAADQRRHTPLFRIDRATGHRTPVHLTRTGRGTAMFEHDIDGGRGDLFLWR
jgi:hypothetical protein